MMLRVTNIFYMVGAAFLALHIDGNHDGDHHHDGDEENASFRKITRETLVNRIADQLQVTKDADGHTVFAMKDVKLLFKKLLFQNCTQTSLFARCNLCVSPEDIVNWYGFVSGQLSESELQEMSVGIVYILGEYVDHNTNTKDIGDACKTFRTRLLESNTSHLHTMLVNKYGAGRLLTEESFGKIIGNINKTFGYQLMQEKFTHDHVHVFNGANVSGDADLKHATTFILTKLLSNDSLKHSGEHDLLFNIGKVFYRFDRLYSKTLVEHLSGIAEETLNKTACFNTTKEHLIRTLSLNKGSMINKVDLIEFAHSFIHATKSECHDDDDIHDGDHDDHDGHDDHDDHDDDHDDHDSDGKANKLKDTWEPWIGALVSIAIISSFALIGIVTVSGRKRKYFDHVMSFLLALGVSVLLCDAMLHLIPHSFGLHGHGDEGKSDKHEGHGDEDGDEHEDAFASTSYLWKCFAVLMGAYLFITMQLVMASFGKGHGHSHGHSHPPVHDVHENTPQEDQKTPDVEMTVPNGVVLVNPATGDDVIDDGDEVSNISTKKEFTVKSISTVAWMILLGDGLHNFMDGIVIGGAFSEPFPAGLQGGIMTSIAVLIHELPHELADFAVLVSTGLSVKAALVLNLLSACTGFIGGIVGLLLGTHWNAAPWILAVTAGLFMYISLGTMLPEVLRNPLLKTSKVAVLIDFLGLIVGLILMMLLAGYEEALKGALK